MGDKQLIDKKRRLSMMTRRLAVLLPAALFLLVLLFGQPFDALSDNTLFVAAADAPAAAAKSPGAPLRVRPVRINWEALDPQSAEIRLNLFDNVDLTAELARVDHSVTGGFVWVGRISGEPDSVVTLSAQNGVLSGSVQRFGYPWTIIRYVGGPTSDLYTIRELDPRAPEPTGVDHIVPDLWAADLAALSPQGATCQEDGTEISVMVAYTTQARDAEGGQDAIEALINRRMSEMNTANQSSLVNFKWSLVRTAQVDYVESGNIAVDLQNLYLPGDGIMDGIQPARDAAKADLVALLISQGSNNTCGMAYEMRSMGAYFQSYAFGVTALDYADPFSCSELTLAHELGHNLGNAHDRLNNNSATLFPYSYGFQSPNETFRTIMAYNCPNGCPRINQWANPKVSYADEPTGVDYDVNPAAASDVARSMNETRQLVSNFRADCVEPTPTATLTPTDVPIPTETPTPSLTPTNTAIPTETDTPTVAFTPTNTSIPTVTPTGTQPTPTKTPHATATTRPTRTRQPTPTSEPTTPTAHVSYLPAVIGK